MPYQTLSWLPQAPADFRARCQLAATGGDDAPRLLQRLAAHALDGNHLARLAKAAVTARALRGDLRPLVPFRLGILSNATATLMPAPLVATALRYGIDLEVTEAPFDSAVQEATSPSSALHAARLDAVLLALDYRGLGLVQPSPGDPGRASEALHRAIAQLRLILGGLRAGSAPIPIVQTLARPPETLFGSLDWRLSGTMRRLIDDFNELLRAELDASGALLLDVGGLAETVGLAAWHDPQQWALAKLPFSAALMPLYADHVARLVAALRGKSRRCLVLDLDNTVWGGVVGDDGIEGITIGQGSALGESFLGLQRLALDLRQRGIVLAVASKNDDAVARRAFREHPDMLLREEHVAVFQANWTDKASNIAAVADALSLGLDALVFLDDNPAERELIRQRLPEVAVPELPPDPAHYARTLAAAGYFEAISFSAEDLRRAGYYQDNARRIELQGAAADLDQYLRSLEMVLTVAPFDRFSRSRIAQLVNKSNQFNLTTRRYTEQEIAAFETDPSIFTMQVRLADRFGDNGMIGVVICRKKGSTWYIDTWLMSCRVLKRCVESAVLAELTAAARADGARELVGVYRPTDRNGMVARHYETLGFVPLGSTPDGSTRWRLDLSNAAAGTIADELPMRIVRTAPAPQRPSSGAARAALVVSVAEP